MTKPVDLTGKKFGRLTVLKRVENTKFNKTQWLCKCDCGKETIAIGGNLIQKKANILWVRKKRKIYKNGTRKWNT